LPFSTHYATVIAFDEVVPSYCKIPDKVRGHNKQQSPGRGFIVEEEKKRRKRFVVLTN
jgi:hypothetical protein